MSIHKKAFVPLEEALNIAGNGMYTNYVTFTTGAVYFCALMSCQAIAIVMPAVGCDLKLSDTTKGTMASMTFTGMLFSGQLFGFLADNFGRKTVALYSQISTAILLTACGLTPNTLTMMVMLFLNGFVLTGVLTPAYVYVSEFTAAKDRAKALVALTAIGALANVYLPGYPETNRGDLCKFVKDKKWISNAHSNDVKREISNLVIDITNININIESA